MKILWKFKDLKNGHMMILDGFIAVIVKIPEVEVDGDVRNCVAIASKEPMIPNGIMLHLEDEVEGTLVTNILVEG